MLQLWREELGIVQDGRSVGERLVLEMLPVYIFQEQNPEQTTYVNS